jgi:hypothetical protein
VTALCKDEIHLIMQVNKAADHLISRLLGMIHCGSAPVPGVQRLSEYVLSARRVVPNIKPVGRCVHWPRHCLVDDLACGAGIDTSDKQIWELVISSAQSTFVEKRWFR